MDARTSPAEILVQARPDRPHYSRLLGLSWLHFLNDGSANYLPGVLPAVLLALHQNTAMAGTVMSALLIGQALQVVSGWFADYIGGRLFILAGVLGSNIAAMMIGLAPSMWALIPALVLIGVSNALFHPQALAGARRLSGQRLGLGMSLFLVGGELGRGIWPLVASLVVVYRRAARLVGAGDAGPDQRRSVVEAPARPGAPAQIRPADRLAPASRADDHAGGVLAATRAGDLRRRHLPAGDLAPARPQPDRGRRADHRAAGGRHHRQYQRRTPGRPDRAQAGAVRVQHAEHAAADRLPAEHRRLAMGHARAVRDCAVLLDAAQHPDRAGHLPGEPLAGVRHRAGPVERAGRGGAGRPGPARRRQGTGSRAVEHGGRAVPGRHREPGLPTRPGALPQAPG